MLETADDPRYRRVGQGLLDLLPVFLRGLGPASGEPDRVGDLKHPMIYLAGRGRRRTATTESRGAGHPSGQGVGQVLTGVPPGEDGLAHLAVRVAAANQPPASKHPEQDPAGQRKRSQECQPLEDGQDHVGRAVALNFAQAFVKLLDLQAGQFQPAEVTSAEQAGYPVAHGDEAGGQEAQEEQNGPERPQSEECHPFQNRAGGIVQPADADRPQDHRQQQHAAHTEQDGEHPSPVHATGPALGGKPADGQTGQTGGEKHQQPRKADDRGR